MTKTRNIALVPLRLSLGLLGAGVLAATPQLASAGSSSTVPTVPSPSVPSASVPSGSLPSSSVPSSSVPVDLGIPVPGQPTQRQFVLGEAATVVLDNTGGRLSVVTIAPHPGWALVAIDEDDDRDDLDLIFRSTANVVVEFDVDATADGGVTVERELCDDDRDDDRDGRDDRDDCDDDRRGRGSGPSSTIFDDHGGRGDGDDHGGRGSDDDGDDDRDDDSSGHGSDDDGDDDDDDNSGPGSDDDGDDDNSGSGSDDDGDDD